MIVITCDQRSDQWFAARLGCLTGSVAGKMLATIKSGEAADRRNLRIKLALERVTGKPIDDGKGFVSEAMKAGTEREPDAVRRYEVLTGNIVTFSGFLKHDTLPAGCSVDGHVGEHGLLEVKAPQPPAHYEYLTAGKLPPQYLAQVLHNLWITGAAWCDWMSYQPDFPEHLQTVLVRVERNDDQIAEYAAKAMAFLKEVQLVEDSLRGMSVLKETA